MISLPSKSVYTLYRPVESSVKRELKLSQLRMEMKMIIGISPNMWMVKKDKKYKRSMKTDEG